MMKGVLLRMELNICTKIKLAIVLIIEIGLQSQVYY